jgi:calumenin
MTPAAAAAATGRKPQVVFLLLCIAFCFLLLLLLASNSPRLEPHRRSYHHRRLKLYPRTSRSASSSSGAAPVVDGGQQKNHHHHAFDPVIAGLEHRLEDKEWEREHYQLLHGTDGDGGPDEHMKEWEDFLKEEEDLINDDRFNTNDRIRALFPKIDIAPQDGFVSLDELIKWNLDQAKTDQLHRSGREMELYDKNGDGIISFQDFKARREETHGSIPQNSLLLLGDWS